MPTKPTTLAGYLAALTAEQRATVDKLRDTIITAAPDAEAVFSYNMPGFKLAGAPLAWVAAWKQHFSIYPLTRSMTDAHADALASYEISKGTLRFPASKPVPYSLVRKLIETRVAELRSASLANASSAKQTTRPAR